MEITLLGFVLGMLLLVIPLYIIIALDLRQMSHFLVSLGKLLALVVLTGGITYLLIKWNSVGANILAAMVMVLVSATLTIHKANLKWGRLIVPLTSGLLISVFVIGLYVLFLVLGLKNPFDTKFFIPIFGLLTGCSIGINANALHTYYMGLHHHHQLYDYLIGNGSTHGEAVSYFTKRCFQSALTSMMRHMSAVVLLTAPVLMLAMVMSGVTIFTAMAMQVMLFVMVLAMSFGSLYITLLMSRRYTFDAYDRLRPMKPQSTTVPSSSASRVQVEVSTPQQFDYDQFSSEE